MSSPRIIGSFKQIKLKQIKKTSFLVLSVYQHSMVVTILLASFAVASFGLLLWQVIEAWRFPLHQRVRASHFHPPVTILKPLKGRDVHTAECLRSWIVQNYGGHVQLLFGVQSSDDPACALVRELLAEDPNCTAQLVTCAELFGQNAKVSQLIGLERFVQHEIICISDADVWVPPDFLTNAIAPLRDASVGLVNCFYQLSHPGKFGMRWEALAVNADFWSQVLQSVRLKPMDFALGAVMLTRRRDLAQIGGFHELAEYLADDYQLGNRIARTGSRLVLCPVVVECRAAPMSFKDVWVHQLRWARTIRVCQPWPFFSSIISNASLWPILWALSAPSHLSLGVASGCLCFRMLAGAFLERRLIRQWQISSFPMAVVKDLLQLLLWVIAFAGNTVTWRGISYRVEPDGKLVRISTRTPASRSPA